MPGSGARSALARNGWVTSEQLFVDLPPTPLEECSELGFHARRLADLERTTGHDVWAVVIVGRVWGMFGYDEYALFLDEADFVLGWSHLRFD